MSFMSRVEARPDSLSVSLQIQPLYVNVEGVENKGLLNGPFFIFSFLFFSVVVLSWGGH